jgi:superfamily II DNA helicase RecQ
VPGPADATADRPAPIDDARIAEVLARWWGFDRLRPLQSEAIRAALA